MSVCSWWPTALPTLPFCLLHSVPDLHMRQITLLQHLTDAATGVHAQLGRQGGHVRSSQRIAGGGTVGGSRISVGSPGTTAAQQQTWTQGHWAEGG